MAGPSNIRINPFTGTGGATNYVELTEKHIIPAVSPYVIRLNEVPEKQDPSNMKMVYVDSATGAATSTTLTEVAATPGQGEFRMDYTTNAMEDKTWNTGLVEFSATDAGKIIEVTYTGTGTLAAVNSNHWPSWYTDRGDGSDGDFAPTEDTTISGVKNYKSVFIKNGITITVDKYALIKCQGLFINDGTINVKTVQTGGSSTDTNGNAGKNGNCSVGGAGGNATSKKGGAGGSLLIPASITINENNISNIVYFGGGGGSGAGLNGDGRNIYGGIGGDGGGSIIIISKSFKNNKINAKGGNGGNGNGGSSWASASGGGGGGGLIAVVCEYLLEQGMLDVSGGQGGTINNRGAAGGIGISFIKKLGVL